MFGIPTLDPFVKPELGTPYDAGDPIARGLYGLYALNEGMGTLCLDHVNRNNLSLVGSAAWGPTFGGGGVGITLPGGTGNYLQSASNVFDPSTTPFTAAVWFYLTATGAQSLLASTGKSWLDLNASTQLRSLIGTTTLSAGASGVPITGAWHHAALVYDGTTLTIYLDGVSVASGAKTISSSTGQLNVGANNSGTNGLTGAVGSGGVLLATRALAPGEILRLAQYPSGLYLGTTAARFYGLAAPVTTTNHFLTLLGCGQ